MTTLAALALTIGGCGNTAEVRYKVTVEVDDSGTRRSGSSVMSFKLSEPTVALGTAYNSQFLGEAVDVDLGGGRTLYALLVGETNDEAMVKMWPELLFGEAGPGQSDRIKSIRKIASKVGAERVLDRWGPRISDSRDPQNQYPLLVAFRDRRDPTSLEAVDPEALDRFFGPGVTLHAIKVRITDEPVTTGMKTRLDWLEAVSRKRSTLIPNPPRLLKDAAPVQIVSPSAFTTELYK
jgi:hypothetical protein